MSASSPSRSKRALQIALKRTWLVALLCSRPLSVMTDFFRFTTSCSA